MKGESGGPKEGGWWQVSVGGSSLHVWVLGDISWQHIPCFDSEACSAFHAVPMPVLAIVVQQHQRWMMPVVVLDTTPHAGPGWGCVTWGHGHGYQHMMWEVGEEKGGNLNMNIHAMTQCHGLK